MYSSGAGAVMMQNYLLCHSVCTTIACTVSKTNQRIFNENVERKLLYGHFQSIILC